MTSAIKADPRRYDEAHRYDGAVIQHHRPERLTPCVIQPRDIALIRDVHRYRFLTATQIQELWWPGRSPRAGQRRLRMLVEAGYLERFRPLSRRGTFAWTYQLTPRGHRLLVEAGIAPARERFNPRVVHDYTYVLHEIQLNAWVLAYRAAAGGALLRWDGETHIQPPPRKRNHQLRLENDRTVEGLKDAKPRPLRPDAVLEVTDPGSTSGTSTFLVEYDRTRRIDKNYDKFQRYDTFLSWWWRETPFDNQKEPPFVVFVCQDEDQLVQFLAAADNELTGRLWQPTAGPRANDYPGRRRVLFAVERAAHEGVLEAWRVPGLPIGQAGRSSEARRVRLPG